ncbi:hypothetical protein AVEN_100851-1 [Araneus ventricosus]|uniref:Uncharacterized protein n=1 Tax=Araneus ventricosus TaxID=182803 RepID=A0A4Y2AWQ7_ARAVE|nr:hypothetical protein AVEN_100851-1 [Araneus ventricosus]
MTTSRPRVGTRPAYSTQTRTETTEQPGENTRGRKWRRSARRWVRIDHRRRNKKEINKFSPKTPRQLKYFFICLTEGRVSPSFTLLEEMAKGDGLKWMMGEREVLLAQRKSESAGQKETLF